MASLGHIIFDAAHRHPARLALDVDGEQITYAALLDRAARLATFLGGTPRPPPALGAVFAARSRVAYEGVLATLLSGAGYVPLSPRLPDARNAHILDVCGSPTVIVDERCAGRLSGVLAHVPRPLVVVMPAHRDVTAWQARHPAHRFVGATELAALAPLPAPAAVAPDAIAYLLFTSGSTGTPKGVMVSHRNVLAHLDVVWERYELTEHDRFSQMFDLTFDLSAFDLFACWGRGASLHVIPEEALLLPDEVIGARQLTVWFSVPSVAMGLRRYRKLVPGAFPSLRLSLFCGERLPADTAAAWQAAAPASIVENLYGPTEVTIACTLYRWDAASSPARAVDGVVPIGRPFRGMTVAVVDPELRPVAPGAQGELCVRGPQVALGYWHDDARTRERWVAMPWEAGADNRWYRTGDLVFVDDHGDLIHAGRTDDQIKLRGHRIELTEVEHALRQAAGTDLVAVLGFPRDQVGPTALTAVVAGATRSRAEVDASLPELLPDYMIPREILYLDALPLTASGKIDKLQLLDMLHARGNARRRGD